MNYKEDSRLAGEIKKGSDHAFEMIYRKYHGQLYGIAIKYLRSQELAEDAIQDIFLKLWSKRQDLDQSLSIRDFLFTMLRNHVLNMIRNDRRRVLKHMSFSEQTKKADDYTPEEATYISECEDIVEKGIRQLPDGKRVIFKMRRLEGLSNDEVAKKLGISIFTVKTQLYHATKFLRDFIKINAGL